MVVQNSDKSWLLLLLSLLIPFLTLCQTADTTTDTTSTTTTTSDVTGNNLDLFTYGETTVDADGNDIYGPKDWGKIQCPNVETCLGFPDKYEASVGWSIDRTNHCQWCPKEGGGCGTHHGSPINLERNIAIEGSSNFNQCIDGHWISYYDSSCTYDELREKNAFTIERHGLKIIQPMTKAEKKDGVYAIDCTGTEGIGRRWGRCDFPKGYSQWWLLSHIDFKVPSEHTQEGKRYSGEIHLNHFYSQPASVTGVDNEMGTIAIYLEVYDDAPDWPILNKIICAWREAEEKNRAACGLPSIKEYYPSCFYYTRGHNTTIDTVTSTQGVRRGLQASDVSGTYPEYKAATSAFDIILENHMNMAIENSTYEPKKIHVDESNLEPVEDFDWDEFIAQQYVEEEQIQRSRHLMNNDHIKWFNYFPMIGVRTEYYFRYQGTQTIPPCYGKISTGRKQVNAWRVFKDPIKVSQRQIDEMHRLIRERIAPKSSPIKACKPDTAAAIDPSDPKKVTVARPLQSNSVPHFTTFCECDNWGSHWKEDRDWCRKYRLDKKTRFYENPYNWEQNQF